MASRFTCIFPRLRFSAPASTAVRPACIRGKLECWCRPIRIWKRKSARRRNARCSRPPYPMAFCEPLSRTRLRRSAVCCKVWDSRGSTSISGGACSSQDLAGIIHENSGTATLFFQRADVLHQIANLISGEFAIKRRHSFFALADDGEEFVVRLFLDVVRTQWTQLQVLAEHGVARSVFAMAGRTFRLVDIGSAVGEGVGGKEQCEQDYGRIQNSAVTAALKRCATQNQAQHRVFQQPARPPSNPAHDSENLILPVQFQRKLELARVVRSGCLTGVGEERAYGRHVVAVGDVEHVGDEIHVEALAKVDALGDAQIVEDCPRRDAGVAAEVAVEGRERAVEVEDARLLENPGGRVLRLDRLVPDRGARGVLEGVGPSGEGRQLEVVAIAGKDVKRPSGAEFDQGGEGPIAEDLARKAVAAEPARLVDAAEDETMTLIEGGGGTIRAREVAVLWGKRGLQVGRIVDGVRPGVGGEELVVVVEALAEIDGQPVVVRSAIGIVGIHVTEGDAASVIECGRHRITCRIESGQGLEEGDRLRHAGALAIQLETGGNGRIQAAGAEKVHQGGVDPTGIAVGVAYGEGTGEALTRCGSGKEIGGHQVAPNGAGIDGTIEVTSEVEVVGDAQGETTAKVALDGQIRLLRVGVNEVLCLRVAERLEAERQESRTGWVEV